METNEIIYKPDIQEVEVITPEEKVFLKILLRNIDPNTGEVLFMCDQTLDMLKNILNKINNIKEEPKMEVPPEGDDTYTWIDRNERIVLDYVNGMNLTQLSNKYGLEIKYLRTILKDKGVAHRVYYIAHTYERTLQLIEKYKDTNRVGERYTPQEDQTLKEEYLSGMHVKDIAKAHRRRVSGIKSRLAKMGFADRRSNVPNVYEGKN